MGWETDDARATQRAERIFLSYVASHYIARRTLSTHLHLSSVCNVLLTPTRGACSLCQTSHVKVASCSQLLRRDNI